jgi:hypothetical protein
VVKAFCDHGVMEHPDKELYVQAMNLINADFPAGLDLDLVVVVEALIGNGSIDALLQARRVFSGFAPTDRDPNLLAMMTRLVLLGWTAADLAGLRAEWPQSHDMGVYHLFRLAWYYARHEGLRAAEIRTGLPRLYPGGTNQPGPIMAWTADPARHRGRETRD